MSNLTTLQVQSESKIKIIGQNQVYAQNLRYLTSKSKIWCNNQVSRRFGKYSFNNSFILDLEDGSSKYSCGQNLTNNPKDDVHYETTKGFCSRVNLEESPRDTLTIILKNLVTGKVEVDGNITYCRCRGQLCNVKKESTIQCYSTPILDENLQTLYNIPKLINQNFFSETNIVSCPIDIAQCYRYGKP